MLQEGNEINIIIQTEPEQIFHGIHELVRMAFPQFTVKNGRADNECENRIILQALIAGEELELYGRIQVEGAITEDRQSYRLSKQTEPGQTRWIARAFVYRLLCRHCDSNINAYGMLTGVRPVKLVHRMLDRGLEETEIIEQLQKKYLITDPKARLLTEVAHNNRPYLAGAGRNGLVSVYIGVPLCPSRCFYCSFPGGVLNNYEEQAKPFVRALLKEMDYIGDALKQYKLGVQTIYIGGGTPTVLADNDINAVFELLHGKYISSSTSEITLEAGRPDTLSLKRMEMFKNAGITRMCINPQTMNDATLRKIGRRHSSADIISAVEWARQAGIDRINMDLIAGLPGENIRDYSLTVERVLGLKPENITVHTLAAKKGSDLARTEGKSWQNDEPVKEGLQIMQGAITAKGYKPYYLYRQKYMRTDAENTGYSLPGCYCLFNIEMIEERQTIIGLGGGAASKLIDSEGKITSIYNPTDPAAYCDSVLSLAGRKVDNMGALN